MDNSMTLSQKAAFIKGMVTGMNYEPNSDEGKIIAALLDLVSDLTDRVAIMDDEIGDLFAEVDAISEDLGDVENYLWHEEEDDEDSEMFDDELYEITCPACGEVICLDEGRLAAEDLACPNCATKFEIDFSDECSCGNENCEDK